MLITLVIILIYMSPRKCLSECEFPNGCELKSDNDKSGITIFTCKQFETKFENGFKYSQVDRCANYIYLLEIEVKTKWPTILDQAFDFDGLYYVYADNVRQRESFLLEISIVQIKGFDINSFSKKMRLDKSKLLVSMFWSSSVFYSRTKVIESCDDYLTMRDRENDRENIFQACSFPCQFALSRFDYPIPICPLAFNNSDFKKLRISGLIDTFYKSNSIRFLDSPQNFSIKSIINQVHIIDMNNINIDKRMFNLDVFKNTKEFYLHGKIRQIQVDLFSSLKRLKGIQMETQFFQPFMHKQSIEWIENINKDLIYNLTSNLSMIDLSRMISIEIDSSQTQLLFENPDVNSYFPNEDFCLYLRFPFHQLVFFKLHFSEYLERISCTLAFLLQYHPTFFHNEINSTALLSTNQQCDFIRMRSNCNKSSINKPRLKLDTIFDKKARMLIWQFISIMITPVISLIGIVGNVLVVIVTSSKKNEKSLKENQYTYMKFKSIANFLILFIQILSLLSDCQSKYEGIYCSSLYRLIGIQYFKIVFNEFLSNYLRFLANLFHVAFAVNRLSLIGKDHSKFTKFMSKVRVKIFLIFSLSLGSFITFVKGFRIRANLNNLNYEASFVYADDTNGMFGLKLAISILNCLCDLLNGPVFVIFCLVIDIQLVVSLKRTTNEKLDKLSNMSNLSNVETTKVLLKNAVFRTIIMVIFNSLVNILLKTPSTILSIVELIRFIIGYHRYQSGFNGHNWRKIRQSAALYPYIIFFNKCELAMTCQAVEEFANFLFMTSISLDVLIYYNFDKKFKEAFLVVF